MSGSETSRLIDPVGLLKELIFNFKLILSNIITANHMDCKPNRKPFYKIPFHYSKFKHNVVEK